MIVVCGEALIDLIATDGRIEPMPGGGPFNTAVALGRLGVPVGFLSALSTDSYGRLLERTLAESGVDLTYVLHTDAPTMLAVAQVSHDGDAEYTFETPGTAYTTLQPECLPRLSTEVAALHVGTLALATDPPRSAYEALIERETDARVIVIDPNVRPGVHGDRDLYCARFERWVGLAHVVKLSAADASWLYPSLTPTAVCELMVELGARLAVLTLGPNGAIARTATRSTSARHAPMKVVDTVGAGDAFGAGLLRGLWETNRLNRDGVGELDDAELTDVVSFAVAVASLQVARQGSSPPTLAEVEAFMGPPGFRAGC
jgi:fructokinase